jgi:hypothetical protein
MINHTANNNNIAMGTSAMRGALTSSNNISLGFQSSYTATATVGSVVIGYRAGYSNNGTGGNVFIGYQAGYSETGNNKLYISNSSTTTPLIGGDFSTGIITLNSILTLTPLASAPSSPVAGMIYVGTDNHIYCYLASSWKQLDN